MAGLSRREVAEVKSDLEEAINQGGADDETVTVHAVVMVNLRFKQTDIRVPEPPFGKRRFGKG